MGFGRGRKSPTQNKTFTNHFSWLWSTGEKKNKNPYLDHTLLSKKKKKLLNTRYLVYGKKDE